MSKEKREGRQRHKEFLKSFFSKIYNQTEHKSIHGFVLFKHWNGNTKEWTVDLFTKESFKKMKAVGQKRPTE